MLLLPTPFRSDTCNRLTTQPLVFLALLYLSEPLLMVFTSSALSNQTQTNLPTFATWRTGSIPVPCESPYSEEPYSSLLCWNFSSNPCVSQKIPKQRRVFFFVLFCFFVILWVREFLSDRPFFFSFLLVAAVLELLFHPVRASTVRRSVRLLPFPNTFVCVFTCLFVLRGFVNPVSQAAKWLWTLCPTIRLAL